MLVKKMGLPWITVSNLQKAKDFYVNVMGFEIVEENTNVKWLEVKCGDSILGVWQAFEGAPDKPGQNAVITFTVDNLENTKEVLEKQGMIFVNEIAEIPGVFRVMRYADQDGNKFQLYQN